MQLDPGTYEYALPPHERIELVKGSNHRRLVEIPYPELVRLRAHDAEIYGFATQGFPTYYALKSNTRLVFYPVPASTDKLDITIWQRVTI